MARTIRMRWEPMKELAFGGMGAAYQKVGTPLSHPAQGMILQNRTDADLTFSFNGIDDHISIAAYTSMFVDCSANKTLLSDLYQSDGDQIWVKIENGVLPSVGKASISAFYSK